MASKLGYRLNRMLREADEMTGKSPKENIVVRFFRQAEYIIKDLWYDHPYMWYYNATNMYANLKFFMPHIIHMRSWDSHYQITLFCDSLKFLAHGLKVQDHCVLSDRNYKRCLFAAQRLRNAYDDRSYLDKSYQRLLEANPVKFIKLPSDHSFMTHDYSPKGEEYYSKMWKLIHKRQEAAIKAEKAAAWAYIHKYIEHWWD